MGCNSKKFLTPLTIYVKILPKLDNGIEMIGFFNTIKLSE